MPRGFSLDLSAFVLVALALLTAAATCWKDPSLPLLGAKNGLSMIWFILPRLVPAMILAGMLQVLIPQETVARYFGQQSGQGRFVLVRVVPSLAFPLIAGWLVKLWYHE